MKCTYVAYTPSIHSLKVILDTILCTYIFILNYHESGVEFSLWHHAFTQKVLDFGAF